MPFRMRRWSAAGRPVWARCGGSSGWSRAHCSSVSSCLCLMPSLYQLCQVCIHTLGLVAGDNGSVMIDGQSVLVRADVALQQIERERQQVEIAEGEGRGA